MRPESEFRQQRPLRRESHRWEARTQAGQIRYVPSTGQQLGRVEHVTLVAQLTIVWIAGAGCSRSLSLGRAGLLRGESLMVRKRPRGETPGVRKHPRMVQGLAPGSGQAGWSMCQSERLAMTEQAEGEPLPVPSQ